MGSEKGWCVKVTTINTPTEKTGVEKTKQSKGNVIVGNFPPTYLNSIAQFH